MSRLIDILPFELKERLTSAEEKLLNAALNGDVADFSIGDKKADKPENVESWGSERTIRAELLYWMCTDVQASQLVHYKGVQIIGSRIVGKLEFRATYLSRPLRLIRCAIDDEIILDDAETKTLDFSGSHLSSIFADGISINGRVFLNNIMAKGEVRFVGANLIGHLFCDEATFENKGGRAFNADSLITKRSIFLRNVMAKGEVRFAGANIGGGLNCNGATFENAEGVAFRASTLSTEGNVNLYKVKAKGKILLNAANIGTDLICDEATFENKEGRAFNAERLSTKGSVFLRKVEAKGEVCLNLAKIGGNLSCTGAIFKNTNGVSFSIKNLLAKDALIINKIKLHEGILNLAHAQVGQLIDDKASWPVPDKLILDGFKYRAFAEDDTPATAKERIGWLKLQPKKIFYHQPYEQLANVFRQMGLESDVRAVLIEKHKSQRKYGGLSRWAKFWNWFLDITIGYGYQTWKVISHFILPILIIGSFVFYLADNWGVMQSSRERVYLDKDFKKTQTLPSRYPRFHPIIYSVDVFVPFVDLHQENYWLPDATKPQNKRLLEKPYGHWIRFYLWFHIAMGWVFSTLAAVSLTGLIRK